MKTITFVKNAVLVIAISSSAAFADLATPVALEVARVVRGLSVERAGVLITRAGGASFSRSVSFAALRASLERPNLTGATVESAFVSNGIVTSANSERFIQALAQQIAASAGVRVQDLSLNSLNRTQIARIETAMTTRRAQDGDAGFGAVVAPVNSGAVRSEVQAEASIAQIEANGGANAGLFAGNADRAPFGNGDGVVTAREMGNLILGGGDASVTTGNSAGVGLLAGASAQRAVAARNTRNQNEAQGVGTDIIRGCQTVH